MNARVSDPARAVLDTVLRSTVEKGRFPREADLRRRMGAQEAVLQRLLEDRRCLARITVSGESGPWPTRVAVTALGHYEAETGLAQRELQGLATARDRLVSAVKTDVFNGRYMTMKDLRARVAPDLELLDFRRWSTVLCSPRLQGRYAWDPDGFCGQSDGMGLVSKDTGFFTHLFLWNTFTTWPGLPTREPRRAFLFGEDGLHATIDASGQVTLTLGGEYLVLGGEQGPRVLAALIQRPGETHHALDLHAHGSGLAALGSGYDYDARDVGDRLGELEIEVDAEGWAPGEVSRMAALLRRFDLLEGLMRSGDPMSSDRQRPRWATKPDKRHAALLDELRAALVDGPLKADFPEIKNVARSVRRALGDTLAMPELAPFRACFEGQERIAYRPGAC